MKKYALLLLFVFLTQACSPAATPIPPTEIPPTPRPTPVGYGVEFPFNPDEFQTLGTEMNVTCEQDHDELFLDADTVRKLLEAGGKLDTAGESSNITFLWTGNVPLELFYEPPIEDDPFGIDYAYSATTYCVIGIWEDGSILGGFITVITKIQPQPY